MTSISGIGKHSQHAALLAAQKAAVSGVRYTQDLQEDRDRIAKTVTAAAAVDETRAHPSLIDTFEADDTFAHTETMKLRGGRIDLIV